MCVICDRRAHENAKKFAIRASGHFWRLALCLVECQALGCFLGDSLSEYALSRGRMNLWNRREGRPYEVKMNGANAREQKEMSTSLLEAIQVLLCGGSEQCRREPERTTPVARRGGTPEMAITTAMTCRDAKTRPRAVVGACVLCARAPWFSFFLVLCATCDRSNDEHTPAKHVFIKYLDSGRNETIEAVLKSVTLTLAGSPFHVCPKSRAIRLFCECHLMSSRLATGSEKLYATVGSAPLLRRIENRHCH